MALKDIGAALGHIGTGFSAMSRNPRTRELAVSRIQANQEAEQEREEKAQLANQRAQEKILDAHLKVLQSGELPADRAAPVIANVIKLSNALGMDLGDPMAFYVRPQQEDIKVGREIVRKTPEGSYENVYTAQPNKVQNRPMSISPGGQLVSPEGEVLHENENPRFAPPRPQRETPTGFKQTRQNNAAAAYEKSLAEDDGTLGKKLSVAQRYIDKRLGDDMMGVGEAKELRSQLNVRTKALQDYDAQYSKAIKILEEKPDVITVAGPAANSILAMGQNALGLLSLLPNVDPNMSVKMEDYADELSATSLGNTEMRSLLFSLALQNAVALGLEKNGLSAVEIENSIKDIGGRTTSPQGLKKRLKEVRARLANSLQSTLMNTIENYGGVSIEDNIQPDAPAQKATSKGTKYVIEP